MRPMRVLIVSQYFSPESFHINEVVQSLLDKGVEVEVLTGKPNYPEGAFFSGYRAWGFQTEKFMGAKIYRLPLFARGKGSAWRLVFNYLSFVLSGLFFAPFVLRGQLYDVIFVYATSPILQAIPALFIGWLKRRRVIVWIQDLWPESLEATGYIRNPQMLGGVAQIVRFIYRHSDLLLVQSRAFVEPVSGLAPGKKVVYHPNSVGHIFCHPIDVSLPEVPALEAGFSVVFAGNLGAGQAVEVIIEAAYLLKDQPAIRFVVFGHGSRWDWMRKQVLLRGLTNLYLPGRFPLETMPGLMQKASVLLVSLADQPIFALTVPNKVQTYLAAGRPILACMNGEGARLVTEANAGLTVPAEDAQGLSTAVLKLYKMSAEERAVLGANGRRYFKENFDQDLLTDQLMDHLRSN